MAIGRLQNQGILPRKVASEQTNKKKMGENGRNIEPANLEPYLSNRHEEENPTNGDSRQTVATCETNIVMLLPLS